MQRSIHLVVLLGICGLVAASACDREAPPTSPRPTTVASDTSGAVADAGTDEPELAFRDPFLWKVTREGVAAPSYLFGTIHGGLDVTWETLPGSVRDAFVASEVVVLETDVTSAPQHEIAARMMLPEGESLEAKLGKQRFEKLVEASGQPAMVMQRFRPWIAQSTLVRQWIGDDQPIDLRLQTFARARDKKTSYLESPIEQIEMLDDAITVEMLQRYLDDPASQKEALDQAMKAYREGDAEALKTAIIRPDDLEEHPMFYEIMFSRRNRLWIPRLEERFNAGPSFVAVGAGHLIGPDNVVDLLREEGWTVER